MTTLQMFSALGNERAEFDSSPHAIATLIDQHRGGLIGLAVSLLRDREAAADVVSDVVEAMFRTWPKLESEQAALAYARTAVVNRSRSALRRHITARRYLAAYVPDPPAPGADEGLLHSERFADVLQHFYRLPGRQREVLALRYFSGLSDAEIAGVLHVTPSTVRSSAARGLRSLTTSVRKNSDD
ncbi:MAG TPA: sigma-70 family RNA polymerase sigma factor [Jatrophihabitantaceae bacterium]|jgi:RNA polymerase sigma factor (sigma-70 family)